MATTDAPTTVAEHGVPGNQSRPAERSAGSTDGRASAILVVAAVFLLTAYGLFIRLEGLQGWDGTLSVDEARLALAARGVVQTGLPRLPSGWIYTRGLLATYLTAPSLAALGESDFAARLPTVLEGAALIPVAYLLGREVAGRTGGLLVAALLMGHSSFVIWSRQAWFYALYVLLYAAALLFILRAHRTGRPGDQVLAGICTALTLYAQEVGIFLLAPLGMQILAQLWSERARPRVWLAPLTAGATVGLAAIVLWLFVTSLRADSMVGAYGEVQEYLTPSLDWQRVRFYLRALLDGPGLLLAGTIVGVPLAVRACRFDTLVLWLALIPPFLHAAFLIPRGPQERYGLTLVLVITVLGAQGAVLLSRYLGQRFRWRTHRSTLLTGAIALGIFLAHQDIGKTIDRAALSPGEGAWLGQARALGIGPDAVVMTDIPTTVAWYLGGVDYWVTSHDFEKYVTRADDVRRDVHTGAIVIRNRSEFDRVVGKAHPGEDVWVIASGRNYQWGELVDDDLKAYLERSSSQRINPGGSARILLLRLPSGY
jgi:4-amino-4-deoxy-L-arabinose transferase-like glycosyltransferase